MFLKYMAAWIFVGALALAMAGFAMLAVGTHKYHTAELFYEDLEVRVDECKQDAWEMQNTCEHYLRQDGVIFDAGNDFSGHSNSTINHAE